MKEKLMYDQFQHDTQEEDFQNALSRAQEDHSNIDEQIARRACCHAVRMCQEQRWRIKGGKWKKIYRSAVKKADMTLLSGRQRIYEGIVRDVVTAQRTRVQAWKEEESTLCETRGVAPEDYVPPPQQKRLFPAKQLTLQF